MWCNVCLRKIPKMRIHMFSMCIYTGVCTHVCFRVLSECLNIIYAKSAQNLISTIHIFSPEILWGFLVCCIHRCKWPQLESVSMKGPHIFRIASFLSHFQLGLWSTRWDSGPFLKIDLLIGVTWSILLQMLFIVLHCSYQEKNLNEEIGDIFF